MKIPLDILMEGFDRGCDTIIVKDEQTGKRMTLGGFADMVVDLTKHNILEGQDDG